MVNQYPFPKANSTSSISSVRRLVDLLWPHLPYNGKETTVPIPDYAQFIGQWNSRVVAGEIREDIKDIAPGYVNTCSGRLVRYSSAYRQW